MTVRIVQSQNAYSDERCQYNGTGYNARSNNDFFFLRLGLFVHVHLLDNGLFIQSFPGELIRHFIESVT